MPQAEILLFASLTLNALMIAGIFVSYRKRKLRAGNHWPIARVAPESIDSMFSTGELGPSRATEIRFIAAHHVWGGISDFETWIICNLARTATRIFEFGTCTGKTTWLLAANAPAASVTSLTLRPEDIQTMQNAGQDERFAIDTAVSESQFKTFYYQGTPEEARIVQMFGDSKTFDETPFVGLCDLVFVDGSHAHSYVESDSKKALRMVKPGGVVLWHDYRGPQSARGVFEVLNALAKQVPLVRIDGTRFVFHSKAR